MPIIGKARRVDAVIHSPQHNKISQYIVDKGIQSECAEHPVMMIRISWPVIMNLEMDIRGKKKSKVQFGTSTRLQHPWAPRGCLPKHAVIWGPVLHGGRAFTACRVTPTRFSWFIQRNSIREVQRAWGVGRAVSVHPASLVFLRRRDYRERVN